MPKARSPNRDKAKQLWIDSGKTMLLKDIAKELDVSEEQVRKWKCQDGWEKDDKVTLPKNKGNVTEKEKDKKQRSKTDNVEVNENAELTEKHVLFVAEYLTDFNATRAAMAVGYSKKTAGQIGYQLLQKTSIQEEIQRQTAVVINNLGITSQRVLLEYLKIAFASVTDYVSFGQKDIPVCDMLGIPIQDENGKEVTRKVNYVEFKDSELIDGTVISEVKQGREGVSIKLHDKMKALEVITRYLDLLPDNHKRRIQEEKLKLDKERLELEKKRANAEGGEDELVDDWIAGVMSDE